MNPSFHDVITANDAERRDLFLGTAVRLGTAVQREVPWQLNLYFWFTPKMGGLPAETPV